MPGGWRVFQLLLLLRATPGSHVLLRSPATPLCLIHSAGVSGLPDFSPLFFLILFSAFNSDGALLQVALYHQLPCKGVSPWPTGKSQAGASLYHKGASCYRVPGIFVPAQDQQVLTCPQSSSPRTMNTLTQWRGLQGCRSRVGTQGHCVHSSLTNPCSRDDTGPEMMVTQPTASRGHSWALPAPPQVCELERFQVCVRAPNLTIKREALILLNPEKLRKHN